MGKFQHFKNNLKFKKLGTRTPSTIFIISDSQIWKIIFFKDVPIISLYFRSILVINTGSEGPDLDDYLEVPEIIQKVLQYVRKSELAILE